jgi:hypothetical protein
MQKTPLLLPMLLILLFGLAGNVSATSLTPEEVLSTPRPPICVIHIVYMPDRKKMIPSEDISSTLTFEVSVSKKDVLEKVTNYVSKKLSEGHVSDFKIHCEFLKN